MKQKVFSKLWWENQGKYQPLIQRFFLLTRLSSKYPATLNIEPTNFCNLDCIFCPVGKTNRPKGYLDDNFYKKLVDQIKKAKKLKVLWLNKDGEPLLHPKIDQLVAYAKKRDVADRIEIYTNGLLLNTSVAKKLIEAKLDSLVVSLDAVDRESFEKLKRKNVYDRVVENINNFLKLKDKLRAKRPLLSVKMVDLGNKDVINKFKKQWQGIVDCVIIQKLHSWEGSLKTHRVWPRGLTRCGGNKKRYPCNLPWLAPAVNWDATVVPCCVNYRKNELVMGNLKKQSLTEIFNGDNFKELRRAHLKQDFSKFPSCARCSFWTQLPNMEWWLSHLKLT